MEKCVSGFRFAKGRKCEQRFENKPSPQAFARVRRIRLTGEHAGEQLILQFDAHRQLLAQA